MYKLILFTDTLGPGGKERQLIEIIKHIDKTKFHVIVISLMSGQHYSEMARQYADDYYEFNWVLNTNRSILQLLKNQLIFFKVLRLLKKLKPDIIHCWDDLTALYSFFYRKLIQFRMVNGSIRDAGIEKGINFKIKRYLLIHSDCIIANSHIGLNKYKVKGHVIYNSIDLTRFNQNAHDQNFNLVMVANFSDYKDHRTFIEASAYLMKKEMVNNAFLVGDGKYKTYFINYIQDSYPELINNFIFTGTITNVEDILYKCSIGILCSKFEFGEGISNAILEYMAAGLITIATDVGGNPEVIQNGVNGFLVNEKDPDAICQIVTKIKDDEDVKIRIIQNAKLTIKEKFFHIQNIKKLEDIYIQLKK